MAWWAAQVTSWEDLSLHLLMIINSILFWYMMVRYWLSCRKKFLVEKALLHRISSGISSLLYSISSRSSGKGVVPCTCFFITAVFFNVQIYLHIYAVIVVAVLIYCLSLLFEDLKFNWHYMDFFKFLIFSGIQKNPKTLLGKDFRLCQRHYWITRFPLCFPNIQISYVLRQFKAFMLVLLNILHL